MIHFFVFCVRYYVLLLATFWRRAMPPDVKDFQGDFKWQLLAETVLIRVP